MVWFQCEDCGENLKKPKLPTHFRICSAVKLSCIDCGVMFNQQNVQSHTQCLTEMEKYGPKGQANTPTNGQTKTKVESKQEPGFDVNVGLSSRPPWCCSLCNTTVTCQQTLLNHAEGKKHKAKARAFHASKQPNGQSVTENRNHVTGKPEPGKERLVSSDAELSAPPTSASVIASSGDQAKSSSEEKRKRSTGSSNGNTLSPEKQESRSTNGDAAHEKYDHVADKPKKRKVVDEGTLSGDKTAKVGQPNESDVQINWKKLVTSLLKQSPDGALKLKKLQKLALASVTESGIHGMDKNQLKDLLMQKITSSSRFELNNKLVKLVEKCA